MKVGILTGGGDCPGRNAVLRALLPADVRDLIHVGSATLGTSRTNPYKRPKMWKAPGRRGPGTLTTVDRGRYDLVRALQG